MNRPLLDQATIAEALTRDAAWAESHGARNGYLGMGLLYYTLTYMLKARVAVCLGSGGGFVPRLMRQAQRDLGLADASRTILVDGNLPEAGWGSPQWLAPDSTFRTLYPDVELVLARTDAAARNFFAPQQISIDYLHIDADHSFAGCLADFMAFRPFLHEGSLVTLHDTNYPGAGVKQVVEHLRTLPDCEVVDIPDIGEGAAVVRIGPPRHGDQRRGAVNLAAGQASLQVARLRAPAPLPPPAKDWKYLESPAFATRYVLAAHFVRDCRSVVEIGGAKTPIDQFLAGEHDAVLVVDPTIRESRWDTLQGRPCQVSHVRACFQDLRWTIPPDADFGLVMLGMEFQGLAPEDWQTLFHLVERARVTVIEFPLSWEPSRAQFQAICANTRTRVVLRAGLDLADNDFGDLSNSWPPRTDRALYVLEPWPQEAPSQPLPAHADQAEPPLATDPTVATVAPAPAGEAADRPSAGLSLLDGWRQACAGDGPARAAWRSDGGLWCWQSDGVVLTHSGVEWSNLEWQPWRALAPDALRNFVLEVTVTGKAEAAGLSFGAYKDCLAQFNGREGSHRLQLEVDADGQRWALRVDGRLENRCWWDAAVHSTDDLLAGVLTLKARNVQEVRFHDLALHHFASSCRLSVIMTCHRFARRLRLSLRAWCHAALPDGAFEVLVVNPQSPDDTHEHLAAVAASYPHLRVREVAAPASIATNKGALINRGVAASSGEWIWLTDADCLFAPDAAAQVLQHVEGEHSTLFYGQRRHLSPALTDSLLAGRLDPVADFAYLAAAPAARPADNAPWGYTQIGHRSLFARLRYSERVNHFARSDDMFVEECKRLGVALRQVPGLFCLHLDHPFAWYGAPGFL